MLKRYNTKSLKWFVLITFGVFFWILLVKPAWADCCRCYSPRIGQCFCYDYKPPNEECKCEPPFERRIFTRDCKDVGECKDPCKMAGTPEEFTKLFESEEKETPVVVPELQIQIPGFEGFTKDIERCLEEGTPLEECQKGQRGYAIPWIGEYIIAIYKWSIGAIAILAIVMIMWGGMQWLMAGGNVSQISDAKSRLTYAVIGLIIILGSNLVLTTINPSLTIFPPIIIGKIERIELEPAEELGFGEVTGCPDWPAEPGTSCKPEEIETKAKSMLTQVSGPCHCACYTSRILRAANCGLSQTFTSVQGVEGWLGQNGWRKCETAIGCENQCSPTNNEEYKKCIQECKDKKVVYVKTNAKQGDIVVMDGHIGLALGGELAIHSKPISHKQAENNCEWDAKSCPNSTVWHGLSGHREWTSENCKTNQTITLQKIMSGKTYTPFTRYWTKQILQCP